MLALLHFTREFFIVQPESKKQQEKMLTARAVLHTIIF